jgi:hypothetical protein
VKINITLQQEAKTGFYYIVTLIRLENFDLNAMALWGVTRAEFVFVYHCKQFYYQHPSGL